MYKFFSNALVLSSLSLMNAVAAQADGNGSGYNGPTLTAPSIPVQLDRGISLGGIKAAVMTCFVTGDLERGLVSTFDRAWTVIHGPITPVRRSLGFEVVDVPFMIEDSATGGGTVTLSGSATTNQTPSPPSTELTIPASNLFGMIFFVIKDGRAIQVEATAPFARLVYGRTLQEFQYGELGEVVADRKIVADVSFEVSEGFDTIGSAIPFRNMQTRQPTAFTLNAKEYVECMKSELQRNAEN